MPMNNISPILAIGLHPTETTIPDLRRMSKNLVAVSSKVENGTELVHLEVLFLRLSLNR
jgi:hypothetical protein